MAKLETSLKQSIDDLLDSARKYYQSRDFKAVIDCLYGAWNLLPEPKGEFDESYQIVKYIVVTSIENKEFSMADKWVKKIYDCNRNRIDSGEREYLHGQVEYALNHKEQAKLLFKIANEKSEGRYPKEKEFISLIK